jgi:CRP/FNR family transcriptional regulator, cyclic AMP receptor protein
MMAEKQAAFDDPPTGPKARVQRALKISRLFDRTSRETRVALLDAAELLTLPASATVFEQGSPAAWLYISGRGRVRIERTMPGGRVVPLGYRGAGDVFGEAAFAGVAEHLEAAVSMEAIEVARIPAPLVRSLFATDPGMSAPVFALLLERHRENEDRIESLLFRPVESRVAEFLIRAADRWGVPTPGGTLISAPITHLEIAQSVGSTRETVTLTLGTFRRSGLLDVAGRRLIVKDRGALAAR